MNRQITARDAILFLADYAREQIAGASQNIEESRYNPSTEDGYRLSAYRKALQGMRHARQANAMISTLMIQMLNS